MSYGLTMAAAPWQTEAQALFGRMSTQPAVERASLINTLFLALKSTGLLAKLDAFYVTAAADAQAAKLNWIGNASYDLVATNGPSFVADRGFTGDGSTSYLTSNFNPTAAAGQFALNSAHVGIWLNVNQQQAGGVIGNTSNGGCYIIPRDASNLMSYRLSQGSTSGPSNTNSKGHILTNRTSSNATQAFVNDASLGAGAIATSTLPNANIDVGRASASSFSTNQIAAAHWGAGLTAPQVAAVYAALQAYMTAPTVGNV